MMDLTRKSRTNVERPARESKRSDKRRSRFVYDAMGRATVPRCAYLPFLVVLLVASPSLIAAGPAEAASRALSIEMREFRFLPDVVTVDIGDLVSISVTNVGLVDHTFVIVEYGVHLGNTTTPVRPNQQSSTKIFSADRIGEFWYFCEIEGHSTKQDSNYSGMAGRFVVDQPDATPADTTATFIIVSLSVGVAVFAVVVVMGLYFRRRWGRL